MATNDGLNNQPKTTDERSFIAPQAITSAPSRRYETPQLVEFGKVEEITRGDIGSVGDGMFQEP